MNNNYDIKAVYIIISIFFWIHYAGILSNAKAEYQLGVYYFPGWKAQQPGAPAPQPWQRIKSYPERKPLRLSVIGEAFFF